MKKNSNFSLASAATTALAICLAAGPVNATTFLSLQEELARARSVWNFQDRGNYDYQYTKQDLLSHQAEYPWTVKVRSGIVHEVRRNDGTVVLPNPFPPTIDDLFVTIDEAVNFNVHSVDIEYSDTHGYPVDIAIDYDNQIADEEIFVSISGVQQLPSYSHAALQAQLTNARNLWDSFLVTTYTFSYEELCLSCYNLNYPWGVNVRNDEIRALDAAGTLVGSSTGTTVPDLFDKLQLALDLRAHEIQVSFDGSFGYPTSIYIDFDATLPHEEVSLRVWNMNILNNPRVDLAEARNQWEALGLPSYAYSFQEFGFHTTFEQNPYPWRVTVSNYQVVSIVDANQNPVASLTSLPSIESIFETIQASFASNAETVEVTYNTELGIPESLFIDYDHDILDEERHFEITQFTVITVIDF